MSVKKTEAKKAELIEEQATPVLYTNRDPWSRDNRIISLNPASLGSILRQVKEGYCPEQYLELAQEIEERDAHYRSVLSTRKHAVEGLEITVKAASEDKKDQDIAQAVREDIAFHKDLYDLIKNALDALGKGFSVNEIIWDTAGSRWKPVRFLYRDPRWFAYRREDGYAIGLRALQGEEIEQLPLYKFVVHEPLLLSGPPVRGGLAMTALFYWLVKHYDVTSWASFVDRYGFPVRIGKYGRKATKEDIDTLKRAVAAIGTDVGAVIPEGMVIEIVESKTTSQNAEVYEKLAEWADKQLSKLVLGQTSTTEGTPGKLGGDQEQENVRQDIVRADARQLEQTLNRDLVNPYVVLNFGEQQVYPRITIRKQEAKDVKLIVDSVASLVPLGLKVRADSMRDLLGIPHPEEGDEILYQASPLSSPEANHQRTALNREEATAAEPDAVDEIVDGAADSDFVEISDDIQEAIQQVADHSPDYEAFKKNLENLLLSWKGDKTILRLGIAAFKARSQGDGEFSQAT